MIKKAKRFGFTLNEIAELLTLFDSKSVNCSVLQKRVSEKVMDIEKRIQELKEVKSFVLAEFQKTQAECAKNSEDNCQFFE